MVLLLGAIFVSDGGHIVILFDTSARSNVAGWFSLYIFGLVCKLPNTHLDNHSDKNEVQFQAQDCVGDVEGRTAR